MAGKSNSKRAVRGADKKADTIQKRQENDKKRLLELLEESPNLGHALTRIGINRSTFYRWKQIDEVFSMNAESAMWIGREKTADMVEGSLLGKARDGDVRAMKLYLENNHHRYMRRGLFDVPETDGKLSPEREAEITKAIKKFSSNRRSGENHFTAK